MRRPSIKAAVVAAVVLAVILAVGSFISTWVVQARQAAVLTQCRNTLKMIGLGLQAYSIDNGSFPQGTVPNPGLPTQRRLSWVLSTMRYMLCMHCCGMNTQVGWDKSWDATENRSLTVTPVYLLQCPGSPDLSPFGSQSATHYVDLAGKTDSHPTPYIGLAGVGKDAALLPKQSPRAGVFGYERVTRPEDIRDGMGTTMMVAETSRLEGAWTAGGPPTVRGLDPSRRPYIGKGRQFGGNHPGGATVLLADGSVRFIRESIDPKVFKALSTIAGGERLPTGWDR